MAARSLIFDLPGEIELQGAALILSGMQKQITITRRILSLNQKIDFLFLLDLRTTRFIKHYGRDAVIEGDDIFPPATSVINRENIADIAVTIALFSYYNREIFNIGYMRPKLEILKEEPAIVMYWDLAREISLQR